jgi:hypothetical protein
MTSFDGLNAIRKQGRQKRTSPNQVFGGSHSEKVAAASTTMKIIQDLFGLFQGETTTRDGVNTAPVEDISNEDISRKELYDECYVDHNERG